MKKLIMLLVLALLVGSSFGQKADVAFEEFEQPFASMLNEVDPNPTSSAVVSEAPGDLLATYDIEAITGETGNLGVEFAEGYLWVTARGLVNPNGNSIWKIDVSSGSPVYVADYPQGNADAWGWRDMAYDGTYLYASYNQSIIQFDPVTGTATGVTFTGPENPNRALAYDPATDK